MKAQPARGTRDYLPSQLASRARVIATVRRVFESFGYAPLETPALERLDVLAGKYGDDADRLIFRILKRGAGGERGDADLGLRYDLTVPLARVMATRPDIPKPFKRYQIQPVWRAEKPQRGRFREFIQCDVDCVGTTSMLADAEIIAITHETLAALGFDDYRISVNHRKILSAFMDAAGVVADVKVAAIRAIDKLEKIGADGVEAELIKSGTAAPIARDIISTLAERERVTDSRTYIEKAREAVGDSAEGQAGIADMERLAAFLDYFGVPQEVLSFDLHMARGLDYYTGPIFESFIAEAGVGSVTGGGRYDGLIAQLGGPELAATGTTIGLERIMTIIQERAAEEASGAYADVLVAVFDEGVLEASASLARDVRGAGLRCELYLEPTAKLGKQFGYADAKAIPFVVVVGPDELDAGTVAVKDMKTRTQRQVARDEVLAHLREVLSEQ